LIPNRKPRVTHSSAVGHPASLPQGANSPYYDESRTIYGEHRTITSMVNTIAPPLWEMNIRCMHRNFPRGRRIVPLKLYSLSPRGRRRPVWEGSRSKIPPQAGERGSILVGRVVRRATRQSAEQTHAAAGESGRSLPAARVFVLPARLQIWNDKSNEFI
jgi:hypothetical protein